MDTVGSERAALMGLSETSAVALLFAATYPERTRAVIAYGSYAGEGDTGPTYPWVPDPEAAEWLEDLERNWGRGVLYLEDFAPSLVGDALYEEWYAKLERLSVSPGAAVSLVRMALEMDVRDILPTIRVPTLVLHKRDDRVVPLDEGKYIADHIPGATFVELPGADHWPWIGHEEAVEEIQEFLTGMRDSVEPERALVTVMFIDIVDSTKRAAELGDRRWADLLERFYAVVRRELDRSRGREIDTAGDGFFMTFDGPCTRDPMRDSPRRGHRQTWAPDPNRDPYGRMRTSGRQRGRPGSRHRSTRRGPRRRRRVSWSRGPFGTWSSART